MTLWSLVTRHIPIELIGLRREGARFSAKANAFSSFLKARELGLIGPGMGPGNFDDFVERYLA